LIVTFPSLTENNDLGSRSFAIEERSLPYAGWIYLLFDDDDPSIDDEFSIVKLGRPNIPAKRKLRRKGG